VIHVTPAAATAHLCRASSGIDLYFVKGREIDDEAVIAAPEAGEAMAAATDGQQQPASISKPDTGNDIVNIGAERDGGWPAVDHRVMNFACIGILGVAPPDESALQVGGEFVEIRHETLVPAPSRRTRQLVQLIAHH
jgi:hypothetical protein